MTPDRTGKAHYCGAVFRRLGMMRGKSNGSGLLLVRRRLAHLLGMTEPLPRILTPDLVQAVELVAEHYKRLFPQRRLSPNTRRVVPMNGTTQVVPVNSTTVADTIAQLRAQFETQVAQAVEARVAEQVARLDARERELADAIARVRARLANVVDLMSYEEFRLVLGCLHPDRAPADRVARFTEAFRIFQRLEVKANPDLSAADLRARGWDHLRTNRRA